MCCRGGKIWYHCQTETKFIEYFTTQQTFSDQWPFTYAGNKLYSHKKKYLLITNINHNFGDSVVWRGQFQSPNVTFNIDRIKYNNICKLLKKLKMNKG